MNINTVVFSGRLTSDPEIREIGQTQKVNVRLVNNRVYFKKDGDKKKKEEEATFIDVVAWGPRAKAFSFLSKGDECGVEGYLRFESWDKDGVRQSKVVIEAEKIHFGRSKGGAKDESVAKNKEEVQTVNEKLNYGPTANDDDVPF